jgi:hypothetical protein
MIFCGQCGLQLPPGASRCPRCGTPVEGDTAVEDFYMDDPTVASFPYGPHTPPQPDIYGQAGTPAPNNPQKLMLGVDKQSTLEPNAPTNRVDASRYNRRSAGSAQPPSSPNADTFRTPPVGGGNFPTQEASYPGYRPQSNYSSQEAPYPVVPPGNTAYASPSSPYHYTQSPISSQKARGRVAALLIILFGLLLILGAMVIFALKQNGLISGTGGANSTVTTLTLQERAKALIERYYNDVNNKNYRNAYNLWKDDPQRPSFATFSQGYAHTRHDDITIDNVTTLSDGTVQVFVTLRATEDASSGTGTQTSLYRGYYIIGPQNGVLKILSGQFRQIS